MGSEKDFDLKLVMENMKDVVCKTDEKGLTTYTSPSCSTVLGYSQDSLIGKSIFVNIHDDDKKEIMSLYRQGIEKKSNDRAIYRYKHGQGYYIWLETTGKVLLNHEGEVVGAVFNSRDVTERKILEERQESFFNLTTDMLGIVNTEGYFVKINSAWEKSLGWSIEELVSKPYLSFVHPDDQEATMKRADQLKAGKKVNSFIIRYLCKDGTYKWTSWKSFLYTEEKLIFFVAGDVTKQINEEKALNKRVRESESALRSTIDNIQGVVYSCKNDKDWTMEYLSDGCYELTGYKPEELINNSKTSFGSLVLDQYKNSLVSLTNTVYEHEYELKTKNGETRWVLDRGKTIFSEDRKAIRQEGILSDITAMKSLQSETNELKERLQLVTENISEVVWLQSPDNSRIIFVNSAFEEVWGFSCDELYKNPMAFMEAIHADDQEVVSDAYNKYIEDGKFDMSYRIVKPDGGIRWVDVTTKEVRNSKGEITGHVGSARDITDLKQHEIAITESEKFLRESQKVGGVGSYVVDVIGDTCQSSIVLNKILGLDEKELHPLEVWPTLIHPDDREAALSAHQKSIEEITNYKQEYRIIRPKDGAVRWVSDVGELELDITGRPSRIVGTIMDITERRELEEKNIRSKKMYQSVVDTQKEMICRYLPDTTINFVNDAYCRAFGKSRQELLGIKYLMFLPAEIHEEELESLKRLSLAHSSDSREFEVTLPDGNIGWQHWTDVGVFDESGKLIEIQGTGYDITERKQAEVEAHRQAQRTKALLQISSHLNAELDIDKVKNIICEEACNALHMQMSAYLSYDSNTQLFQLAASSGLTEEAARAFEPLSRDDIEMLLNKQGKVGVIPDLSAVPELPIFQTLLNQGIQSKAYSLVERGGVTLGFLVVGAGDKNDFSEDSIALLSGLANQAASAITNARLFNEAKNRLNQVQALRNIDLAITGSLDLRVTFQVVLDEVTKMLQTDAAAILRLDPHSGTLRYEHWRGFRSRGIKGTNIPLGEGYVGRMALNRKSVHIHDLREHEHDFNHIPLLTEEGFVAYYAVPLIAKGTVLGVLEVFHRERIASNGEWLAFLEILAGQAAIAIDNAELFSKLERSNVDLLRAYDATIEGWAHALDLKDEETEDHSQRVTELTLRIAGNLGIKDGDLAHVRRGALLHDIGKMGIPDSILLKPGKLTDEEWEIMRKHPVYAFEMISSIDYLRPALDIPYCHHEKWDGSGYPRGLKGKQIPPAARIFAVVDVYDALTSDRPYRKAWTKEKTLENIKEQSGKHFDPQVVDVFIKEIGG